MQQKIKVTVDKRTELLYVILGLSDYFNRYPEQRVDSMGYPYKAEVDEYFKDFKNHKVVGLANDAIVSMKGAFSYDALPALFLQLDENLDFQGYNFYPFVDRLNKSPLILELLNEAKNFAKESNFDKFYSSHLDFYNSVITSTETYLKDKKISEFIDEFYKLSLNRQYLIKSHFASS